jgi:enoyl-CoA hydratase
MADEVLSERRGRVLLITLNRPESRNAINTGLAEGVLRAVEELDGDASLAAGVLTGAGAGFCSGMDLKAFAAGGIPEGFTPFLANGSSKPLIAAIEGFAVAGGLEVALTCDLLVASRGARLGIPEVKVGLFAAGGALLRLQRRGGYGIAMEMALTGEPIAAEDAHACGLVSRLAEPGHAVEVALDIAERIAANAPLAVAASKRLIRESQGLTEPAFWELQRPLVLPVFTSQDAEEGPRAFAEKRPPVWTGR